MDVTAVQPVRFQEIVAIPDATRRAGFAVAANQTLDGQVVSVQGDTVIVSIGRQQVPAQAAPGTTLQAGEAVRLFVRDVDPDRVVMQIVARGTSLQTLRSLTPQDLSAELTGLGIAPDETAIDVARALINRGLPVTAQNVLDVRAALARLGAPGPQDLDAAVFLKGQGLPMTADAVQIVRQALQSRSVLGAQVEGLRTALADLAGRLAALGVTPAPRGPFAPPATTPAAPAATEAPDVVTAGAPGAAGTTAQPPGAAVEAPAAGPPAPGAPSGDAAAPPAAASAEAPPANAPSPGAGPTLARSPEGPPAAAAPSPAPGQAPTAGGPTGTDEAPPSPLPAPPASGSPAPGEGQGEGVLSPAEGDALTRRVPSGWATLSQGERGEGAGSALLPQRSPAASGGPPPEPSLPRLLSVVAETLERLPLLDERAVAEGPDELTDRIRRVIADQATPVEAKLARVLEGLASRADLDRLLAGDLKTTLHALVRETQAHLDPRAAEGLPTETLRDLQTVGRQAEALLGQVELQQLANAAPRPDGQAPTYLVFQLPIPGGREPQTAQIRIRQDADGKAARIDPKNVQVVFQFELQHLRTIRVGIRVVDRRMSCQIGSSDPAVTDLLAERADQLRAGLAGLGYAVDPVKTAVLTPEELAPPPSAADAPLAAPHRPAMRVDARA
ncbi:MAG TPA: flagellar hook-length control protein FliK [Chloroflexota bacterium]|nr:flagellar hook-length control protein FliK [Chloroflexota bacterium]